MKILLLVAMVAMGALSICSGATASAGERGAHIGWKVHQPTRFMVSGILRQDGATDEKLYHAIVEAPTEQVALDAYVRSAVALHPGYRVVGTLATPVPPAGSCENNI